MLVELKIDRIERLIKLRDRYKKMSKKSKDTFVKNTYLDIAAAIEKETQALIDLEDVPVVRPPKRP